MSKTEPSGSAWQRLRMRRQLRRALRVPARQGVAVATFPDEASARVAAGSLAAVGIKTFVFVEQRGAWDVPLPGPAHVIVRPEDESAARQALA